MGSGLCTDGVIIPYVILRFERMARWSSVCGCDSSEAPSEECTKRSLVDRPGQASTGQTPNAVLILIISTTRAPWPRKPFTNVSYTLHRSRTMRNPYVEGAGPGLHTLEGHKRVLNYNPNLRSLLCSLWTAVLGEI